MQNPQATDEELLRAHTPSYIQSVRELYRPGATLTAKGEVAEAQGDSLIISGDIYCNRFTEVAARTAAGCAVEVSVGGARVWKARLGCCACGACG